jgi:hypothetical protein
MEERRSGGGAHAGAGDRAEAALSLPAARAGVPLSRAESQYQQRQPMRLTPQQQRAYLLLQRDISRSDGVHEGAAAATVRHRTCSSDTVYIFTMNLTMSIEFGPDAACDGRTNVHIHV